MIENSYKIPETVLELNVLMYVKIKELGSVWGGGALADPHTKVFGACPLKDPILSFSHAFSPKIACIGGQCPPTEWIHAPQWEMLDLPLGGVGVGGRAWIYHCMLTQWSTQQRQIQDFPLRGGCGPIFGDVDL